MSNNIQLHIPAKPWLGNKPPKRVLAIRLQAMGDTVITLPYLNALRKSLPEETQLDFLTRKEVDSIPKSLALFNHVYSIGGKRNFYKQCVYALFMLPRLIFRRYDVVLDLQNNPISRYTRKILNAKAWSEFDKYSPHAAGERTRLTIEAAGFKSVMNAQFQFKTGYDDEEKLLLAHGWDGASKLVILNPAAAFGTRNWNIDNYVSFAKLWLQQFPDTQFVAMGTNFIKGKALYLKEKLRDKLICLIDRTTPAEGFKIIQRVQFVLSEDSGLMHMSWVSDKPTVAILGSTRSDWVSPQNKNSLVFSSDDLPCGNCMREFCSRGDVHCLTRYTPEFIFEKVKDFITKIE
ncbi:hypothetical protein A9P82_03470 [Arachidicoccus ginsenosidimutans]|uniref:glycosyltransferase family 9 protein n=1 Tax=Arachidicoccus sp. BS20 TaxID=1850526 RepID=UPI0007F0C9CB|nr:glycosyltransferase family 9 protein [Arachidicoccus sp. BS20]ANI88444.1 hypothetical protein A9P82_03470 [Arachidicoccus sp. BS20]